MAICGHRFIAICRPDNRQESEATELRAELGVEIAFCKAQGSEGMGNLKVRAGTPLHL